MTIDQATFRSVLGRFASGVTVITARGDDGNDHGMTVSAFCSVSLEPPIVLASIWEGAEMWAVLQKTEHFGVNILASEQEAISRRFAEHEGDRFDGIGYSRGTSGVALLDGALAYAECRVIARHVAGDHTLFLGEVDDAAVRGDRPLLYYRGGYARLER
jgi:flavin reductase (DIM6/NTAB) family NADH-FMN oxidoreductase RutF